jgi:bifunctional enzyme CysN/CysC
MESGRLLVEALDTRAKDLLRIVTCGSVDDGKSTLIGRLLHDCKLVFDDQLAELERDSRRYGAADGGIDYALLVDGLEAEREQSITIDVGYKYFSTPHRSFIVADAPGHEQYTRNMATAASTADAALLLVDARKGLLSQTKRHALICSLFGVRDLVLAINKIDLVDYDENTFNRITAELAKFTAELQFTTIRSVPISARLGDNILGPSPNTKWYDGPSLMHHLENVEVESNAAGGPFRFPIQWVNRTGLDFRGYAGTIASGSIRAGDRFVVAASGRASSVARIVTQKGDLTDATAGDAVTLTFADEIDVARGDLLVSPTNRPDVADQFAAHLLWMADEPMLPGRPLLMRIGAKFVAASVSVIKHRLDVNTQAKLAATTLGANEIGYCNLSTSVPVSFDAYKDNRQTGAFILIDRVTNQTVACGMIDHALRRATNVHRHALSIDKTARSRIKLQAPCVVWFTGLSGAGKSTIADLLEKRLNAEGRHTMLLDADNIRHGLNADLGFTDADRVENVRRIGQVAKLFVEAGTIVICAFIAPFEAERRLVREMVGEGEFFEIFVDASLESCIDRDPKGLYAKALAGRLPNFTGIDSPYERPMKADLVIDTLTVNASSAADSIISLLRAGQRFT